MEQAVRRMFLMSRFEDLWGKRCVGFAMRGTRWVTWTFVRAVIVIDVVTSASARVAPVEISMGYGAIGSRRLMADDGTLDGGGRPNGAGGIAWVGCANCGRASSTIATGKDIGGAVNAAALRTLGQRFLSNRDISGLRPTIATLLDHGELAR
jgi:hypothetical protein